MTAGEVHPAELAEALAIHGLILRGGFHPDAGEAEFDGASTVFLVGNAGRVMWDAFAPYIDGDRDPLNRWTRSVIDPIAERFEARAVYPFGEPHRPFQRWAARAETLYPSPIGIMIHPVFGLWHAWRAAFFFAERLPLPPRSELPNPCDSCAERPCLSACPAGAFSTKGYDIAACGGHLGADRGRGADCHDLGCHARNACPIEVEWRYAPAQIRFHMEAFARAVAPLSMRTCSFARAPEN